MAGILAAGVAPWVVTRAGVLMPVRQRSVWVPDEAYLRAAIERIGYPNNFRTDAVLRDVLNGLGVTIRWRRGAA